MTRSTHRAAMAVTLFLTSMSSCPWAHKLWEEKGKGEGAAVEFEVVTDSVGIQPLSHVWEIGRASCRERVS